MTALNPLDWVTGFWHEHPIITAAALFVATGVCLLGGGAVNAAGMPEPVGVGFAIGAALCLTASIIAFCEQPI